MLIKMWNWPMAASPITILLLQLSKLSNLKPPKQKQIVLPWS
jgi:hypothetical protein